MEAKGSASSICRGPLRQQVSATDVDSRFISLFVGGRGFGSKILYDEVSPGIGPFDEGNKIILTPGALLGTGVPAASRTTLTTKSALTEMHGDGHASGTWGASLKYAGYDGLVIEGKAEKPVYIWIEDDRKSEKGTGCFSYGLPLLGEKGTGCFSDFSNCQLTLLKCLRKQKVSFFPEAGAEDFQRLQIVPSVRNGIWQYAPVRTWSGHRPPTRPCTLFDV